MGRTMSQLPAGQVPLYPLRFEPLYEYRPWGGRQLAGLLTKPLSGDGPIGEAWVLSDRQDHQSRVADGPLKGSRPRPIAGQVPPAHDGGAGPRPGRFPLLLKFLDARELLSVQVHPSDHQTAYLPAGDTGKTEAWVVLEAGQGAASMPVSGQAPPWAACGPPSATGSW